MTTRPPAPTFWVAPPADARHAAPFARPSSLTITGLETVYDTLASAIDEAGPDKAQLFLVKLALLNANALADADLLARHTATALRDL